MAFRVSGSIYVALNRIKPLPMSECCCTGLPEFLRLLPECHRLPRAVVGYARRQPPARAGPRAKGSALGLAALAAGGQSRPLFAAGLVIALGAGWGYAA
jgi:hypothetical protein